MAMPIRVDEVTTIEQLLALPDDGLRHELLDGVHVVFRREPGHLVREWSEIGVAEYWIVDLDARLVERSSERRSTRHKGGLGGP